jgi:hypothetical protein
MGALLYAGCPFFFDSPAGLKAFEIGRKLRKKHGEWEEILHLDYPCARCKFFPITVGLPEFFFICAL